MGLGGFPDNDGNDPVVKWCTSAFGIWIILFYFILFYNYSLSIILYNLCNNMFLIVSGSKVVYKPLGYGFFYFILFYFTSIYFPLYYIIL